MLLINLFPTYYNKSTYAKACRKKAAIQKIPRFTQLLKV